MIWEFIKNHIGFWPVTGNMKRKSKPVSNIINLKMKDVPVTKK